MIWFSLAVHLNILKHSTIPKYYKIIYHLIESVEKHTYLDIDYVPKYKIILH